MSRGTRILALLLAVFLAASGAAAPAEKKFNVVATFSILGDLAKNVGGDRVEVTTLVGPNGDVHVYEPTPADAKAVGSADVVLVNGLALEGWMNRLIKTSGFKGPVVEASQWVKPREMAAGELEQGAEHGPLMTDPHAWQDVGNARLYVQNIAKGLEKVDSANASVYRANAEAYTAKLGELDRWVRKEFSGIPKQKRRMITTHDAFGYFGAAYGIAIISPVGFSTESEASAGDIANLIKQIRREKITAVFLENVSDPRLMEQVAKESGVTLGGTLYSDALSKPDGPAPTYLEMFKNNVSLIAAAMRKGI
ncbi:MAG: metal ABC transporter substrate-binding protein [Desulfobaccales bacterium]